MGASIWLIKISASAPGTLPNISLVSSTAIICNATQLCKQLLKSGQIQYDFK